MTYQEIEPAAAKAGKDIEWDAPRQRVELKADGWRFLMHFGGGLDRTYMTGRRISSKTNKFSEKGLCAPNLWPANVKDMKYTVIDGEVMPPRGAKFADIAGIMNVEPEKAAARIKEIGQPLYYAFDCLFYEGKDIRSKPLHERLDYLGAILGTTFNDDNLVKEMPHAKKDPLTYYERIVEKGGEGVIVKDLAAPYGKGWLKAKRYSTLDVVVTGFTEAEHGVTGKYVGLIGAVVVSVKKGKEMVEVGQVSGMTDELRKLISKHKSDFLGSVIEIKAQELAKDRLRHPRWGRHRPEADPRHATWEKMIADLKAAK